MCDQSGGFRPAWPDLAKARRSCGRRASFLSRLCLTLALLLLVDESLRGWAPQEGGTGDLMASNMATTHLLLRRRIGRAETFALVLAALAFAVGAAAWMADADRASAALPEYSDTVTFGDRFLTPSPRE